VLSGDVISNPLEGLIVKYSALGLILAIVLAIGVPAHAAAIEERVVQIGKCEWQVFIVLSTVSPAALIPAPMPEPPAPGSYHCKSCGMYLGLWSDTGVGGWEQVEERWRRYEAALDEDYCCRCWPDSRSQEQDRN
jgi:hypothetical protein